MSHTLVVIGSGPGIGIHTATLFASKKFTTIALVSRDGTRLSNDRATILSSVPNANVHTFSVDITDTPSFKRALTSVSNLGNIECVFFNAARVAPSTLLEFPEEEILQDFKTNNIALYTTAQWAIPLLQKTSDSPSFLVTSSLLWEAPVPAYFSLSLVKASQKTLVEMLHMTNPDIHVGILYVDGVVKLENKVLNPKTIAEKFWELYAQKKEEWTWEMTLKEA